MPLKSACPMTSVMIRKHSAQWPFLQPDHQVTSRWSTKHLIVFHCYDTFGYFSYYGSCFHLGHWRIGSRETSKLRKCRIRKNEEIWTEPPLRQIDWDSKPANLWQTIHSLKHWNMACPCLLFQQAVRKMWNKIEWKRTRTDVLHLATRGS